MTFRFFPTFLCSGRAEALVTDCISKYYSRLSQEWQNFSDIFVHLTSENVASSHVKTSFSLGPSELPT